MKMIRKQLDQLHWLEFELLADFPHLIHGVLLRQGGSSLGNFSGLNLSRSVGDRVEHVEANLQSIRSAFSLSILFSTRLTHGADVVPIDPSTIGRVPFCDGMMTHYPELALLNTHADCQVAIFYDPIKHVLANVHSGWRGSVKNIYAVTVQQMKTIYGSKPENLLVCISPSLGPQSAEFVNYQQELPQHFWSFQVKPNYFDFWKISEWQLHEAGILPTHLQIACMDTFTNSRDYFSYRRDKITGRQGTFACLRKRD